MAGRCMSMQRIRNNAFRIAAITAMLLTILGACGPEANRPRERGLGADVGNHAGEPEVPASKVWSADDPGGDSRRHTTIEPLLTGG